MGQGRGRAGLAEPKYETRHRYFTAHELHGRPLSADRLLYLELLEVDSGDGVARFRFALNVPAGEVWGATVKGWESRPEVQDAVREAAVAAWVRGDTLTIPLSAEPQVTQLEVRSPDLTQATVYRITTQGTDPRAFRYRTETDPGAAVDAARLIWREEDGRVVAYTPDEGAQPNGVLVVEDGEVVFDTEATEEGARGVVSGLGVLVYTAEAV